VTVFVPSVFEQHSDMPSRQRTSLHAMRPASAAESYFVHLEWDRGHESLDAIVLAESPDAIVVQQIHDHVPALGFKWIRRSEIVDLREMSASHPAVRLASIRRPDGQAMDRDLTHLSSLLHQCQTQGTLVMIQEQRTGSSEGQVGDISALNGRTLSLQEIDTNVQRTGETITIELDQIISVEWDSTYLVALSELLQGEGQAPASPVL
jgi:hypothetical protein